MLSDYKNGRELVVQACCQTKRMEENWWSKHADRLKEWKRTGGPNMLSDYENGRELVVQACCQTMRMEENWWSKPADRLREWKRTGGPSMLTDYEESVLPRGR